VRTVGALSIAVVLAGLAALPPAQAQGRARYEPVQRTRVGALDACLKDEVMNGAFCVKQCAPGFKMEIAGRKAACQAVTADARVPAPKPPEYTPPAKLEAPPKGA